MSQSILFKELMAKKVEENYYYLIYKVEYKLNNELLTPLELCNNYENAQMYAIKYNIKEFDENYIFSKKLMNILK